MYRWDTLVLLKHYLASGLSKTAIARQLGISRRVIYHWLRTGQLDRDVSQPVVTVPAVAVERRALGEYATLLAEAI